MARPSTKHDVVISNSKGDKKTVIMTSRQEELFNLMRNAGGRLVRPTSIYVELGIDSNTLRVVKCHLAKLLDGFYDFVHVTGEGYVLNQL